MDKTTENIKVIPLLHDVDFQTLMAYDVNINQLKRDEWIKPLVEIPDSVAAVNRDNNEIVGYVGVGFEQNYGKYLKVGPLLADSPSIAAALLRRVIQIIPEGYNICVKIPTENGEAISLMEKIGFCTEMKAPDMFMFNRYKRPVLIRKVYSVLNGWNQFA